MGPLVATQADLDLLTEEGGRRPAEAQPTQYPHGDHLTPLHSRASRLAASDLGVLRADCGKLGCCVEVPTPGALAPEAVQPHQDPAAFVHVTLFLTMTL